MTSAFKPVKYPVRFLDSLPVRESAEGRFDPTFMLHQIGIGIPTKDRWEDLALTLRKLEEFGLGDNETIVMDDASREPAPQALRERFPRVRFERSELSRSVTGQRNLLARMLSSRYFLQVDNDSFPVRGDLAGAVSWLERQPDALALAFVVAERDDWAEALRSVGAEPYRCHYFIGCAALIKREKFLELGGYEESLEYLCEEVELAAHGSGRSLFIYQYPGVVVRHQRSPVSRDQSRRWVLLIRNELTIAVLHYPLPFLLIRWPLFTGKALVHRWVPPRAIFQGVLAALKLLPKAWRRRQPLSWRSWLIWKRLPRPIKIVA
jgi:GT2 family glycosyltransferase